MKKNQTSYAFLMEMLWVCGFFALSACLFVLVFLKADQLSRRAENLNHAVLLTQNSLESRFADFEQTASDERFYDRHWNLVDEEAQAAFILTVSSATKEGLLTVTAAVTERQGELLYQLEGARSTESAGGPARTTKGGGNHEKSN